MKYGKRTARGLAALNPKPCGGLILLSGTNV
jgi:hypothetical protein